MVKLYAGQHLFQLLHRTQNVRALGGMGFHDLVFVRSQGAGLLENTIFDTDLTHIVQLG